MTIQDSKTITFSMQEVTKILLKEKGIKQGYYIAHISPNLKGTIVNISEHDEDENSAEYRQAMIIAFDAIELIEVSEKIPTAIDASQLN
jgi:hypothetical protein